MTEAEWLSSNDPAAMLARITKPGDSAWPQPTRASDRKLRLFACACVRQVWGQLTDIRSREVVEVSERYIDGLAADVELGNADNAADLADHENGGPYAQPFWAAECCTMEGTIAATEVIESGIVSTDIQATLLRDIFGNPFRPIFPWATAYGVTEMLREKTPLMSWLIWNNGIIAQIAQAIYDERRFEDMPILADSLEEAGCTNEEILMHCRGREREICHRCDGDGKAHGADRPFEWSPDPDYMKCSVCKGSGIGTGWRPMRGPHVRGCWAIDCILGKS